MKKIVVLITMLILIVSVSTLFLKSPYSDKPNSCEVDLDCMGKCDQKFLCYCLKKVCRNSNIKKLFQPNYDIFNAGTRIKFNKKNLRVFLAIAHPDDEQTIAPLLGKLCNELKAKCTFLVATRGEAGGNPNLRVDYMKKSAAIFNSRLVQWELGNIDLPGESVSRTWENWVFLSGGEKRLRNKIESEILKSNPDIIFTFDPRTGYTCHQDHMLIGKLTIDAYKKLNLSSKLYLIEYPYDIFHSSYPQGLIKYTPADPENPRDKVKFDYIRDKKLKYFDSSEFSEDLQNQFYVYKSLVAKAHKLSDLAPPERTYPEMKRDYLLDFEDYNELDKRYDVCFNYEPSILSI